MINYISQDRKVFITRNNGIMKQPLCLEYDVEASLDFQIIDKNNQIVHIDDNLSGLYLAVGLKLGEPSRDLLALSKDYTISNDTIHFSLQTYTENWLNRVRKASTEAYFELGQMSLNQKRVIGRDYCFVWPRCYIEGLSPQQIDTSDFYNKTETQELLAQNLAESKDYTDSKIAEIDLDSYATDADLQAAKTELEGDIALKASQADLDAVETKADTNSGNIQTLSGEVDSLAQDITGKAAKADVDIISGKVDGHIADNTIHVTAAEKTSWNAKAEVSDIPTDNAQLTNGAGYQTAQDVQNAISGKAETSYVDTELAKKQNTITSESKLPYSLVSDTPDLSVYATEADLQVVSGAVDEKLDNPSGGTAGQVLTKTADGAEWADAQGGGEGVNPAYVELEEKTASAPATFEVDFSGKQIQKYPFEDAASGSIAFTVKNSGAAGDGYAPTVELQIPVSGEISTITLPEGAQVVDMPASLTGELSNDRIKKGITYHDLVFRNEKNFAGHWQTYISHGYSFQELEEYDYFWLEAREDDSTVSCDNFNASYNLSSSFDKLTWTALTGSTIATGVNAGTKIYFIGNTTTLGTHYNGGGWNPYSDKKYAIGGKILSLYSEWIEPVTLTNDYDLIRWQQDRKLLEECSVDFGPVKNTYQIFGSCSKLSALSDGFNVPNATNTKYLFDGCSSLSGLPDGFSCPNTTDTNNMFNDCSSLSALPEGFSVPNATNTAWMFRNCSKLSGLPDSFSCPNTTDTSYMFARLH